MATSASVSPKKGGDLFLEVIAKVDPATNRQAELLVDTNVVLEFMSFGDLIREGDKHREILEVMSARAMNEAGRRRNAQGAWRSPTHRYRQLRARASIILMWVLAERRLLAGMLGKEMLDILDRVSPIPRPAPTSLLSDGTSYALTTVIVQAIHPMLNNRGLHLGALTEVNHRLRGNKADAELLRLAQRDRLPIITNEGYTVTGLSDFKSDGSKSLRGLGRDAGVTVYSPREYLDSLHIDIKREAHQFIQACEGPLIDEYLRVGPDLGYPHHLDRALDRAVETTGYPAALEHVIPLYRLILLDERDEALEAIEPPKLP